MRSDLQQPVPSSRPLVGDVEAIDAAKAVYGDKGDTGYDRDEAILLMLRQKLKGRTPGSRDATVDRPSSEGPQGEDKYEPQRLNRKICWQYDQSAHKIPLIRRHYI